MKGSYFTLEGSFGIPHCWARCGRCILDVTATQFTEFADIPLLILPCNSPTTQHHYSPDPRADAYTIEQTELDYWGCSRVAMEKELLQRVRHYMKHPPALE